METKFKFIKKLKNQKGFSLVELMVVVAIIGILAAIAIPNFQRYQSKSRQTEAKLTLGGMYASQRIFAGEWNYLSADLQQIGFAMDGNSNSRYRVGWAEASEYPGRDTTGYNGPVSGLGNNEGTIATADRDNASTAPALCNTSGTDYCTNAELIDSFAAGETTPSGIVPSGCSCSGVSHNGAIAGTGCTPGTITCTAVFGAGVLSRSQVSRVFTIGATGDIGGSNADKWWIDSTKRLVNTQNGVD